MRTNLRLNPHNQKESCKLVLDLHVVDEALCWKCLGILDILGKYNFFIHVIA